MKFQEITGLTTEELRKKVKDKSEELFQLKMKNTLGQVSNPLTIRGVRRDVARLKTALTQKLS